MEREDYIPLFFYTNQPIDVIIIANELLYFELTGSLRNTGQYAFYLLSKLSKNELLAKNFPQKLIEKQNQYFDAFTVPWPCLTGILFETNHCKCLSAKVEVKDFETNSLVHFSEFAVMNGHSQRLIVDEISKEVSFEPLDAYILLANQVATCYSDTLFLTFSKKYKEHYRFHLRETLLKRFKEEKRKSQRRKNLPRNFYSNYTAFCLDYFEYLEEQLLAGRITPYEILRLNGPAILDKLSAFMLDPQIINEFIEKTIFNLLENYDDLSFNQRIISYTLYRILSFADISSQSIAFHRNRNAITKRILFDFPKPFPKFPKGQEDIILSIWKKYGID